MAASKNNQGQQTEMVKHSLVRYIRESGLMVGDRLPSQAELRGKLGVGSETIRRAVFALCDSGLLELRGNKGVFLRDKDADGTPGRNIGIVCMRVPLFPFGALLMQSINIQLHDRGWQPVIFVRNMARMEERDSLSFFTGLKHSIECRRLDGLISLVPLDDEALELCAACNVPVCYYGDREAIPHRVSATPDLYQAGLREMFRAGCRRPALLLEGTDPGGEALTAFREVCAPRMGEGWERYFCFRYFNCQVVEGDREGLIAGWEGFATEIAAMPEAERPDGLFLPDDFMTVYIVGRLRQLGIPVPPILTLRSRQIPLGMPFELIGYFEEDGDEIAKLLVDLLFKQMTRPESAPRELFYRPRLVRP